MQNKMLIFKQYSHENIKHPKYSTALYYHQLKINITKRQLSQQQNQYNLKKAKITMEIRRSQSSSRLSTPQQHKNQLQKYQICEMLGQGQFGKVYKVYIKNNALKEQSNVCSNLKNSNGNTNTSRNGSRYGGQKSGKKQGKYGGGLMRTSSSKNNKSVRQLKEGKMMSGSLQILSSRMRHQQVYAMKIIPLNKLKKNPKLKQLLLNQVHILNTLTHPHIIHFHQIFLTKQSIHMLYQHCEGGSLQDRIPLQINSQQTQQIFYKIIKACAFAQKNNILHRDLKPANILFRGGEPKVADWGFSRYLDQGMASSFVGSPAYMAPEILRGSQYTSKADVWSFGVMMYECLYNKMPWPAASIKQLLHKLQSQPLSTPTQTNPTLRTLLKLCLQTNPQKRASFQKLQKLLQISRKTIKTQKHQNPQKQYSNKKYFGQDYICEKQKVGKKERFSKYDYFGNQEQQHEKKDDKYEIHDDVYEKEEKENDGDDLQELDQNDIKKCSRYLEFAKAVQRFEDDEAKMLCLQLIVTCLRNIKGKYQSVRKSEMTPCLSQRKMNITKRQSRSPQTSKKQSSKSQHFNVPQTHELLNKEIMLIKKMQKSLTSSPYPHQTQSSRILIRQLLKKMLKNITVSQKQYNEYPSNTRLQVKGPSRKQLLQMNDILQVIMYEKDMKEDDQIQWRQRQKQKEKEIGKMSVGELIRMVNCRILYVNRKYCQKN